MAIIFNKQKEQKAYSWKDKFMDEPCFILGSSPSLNDFSLDKLSEFLTIGINRTFLKIETSVLMWQDIDVYLENKDRIKNLNSFLYSSKNADPNNIANDHFKVIYGEFKQSFEPGTYYGSGSTIPIAFQHACVMGCSPIIILGYDCLYRNGITNFYGNNKRHNDKTLENCNRGLSWIKKVSVDKKVMILNSKEELDNIVSSLNKQKNILKRLKEQHV